MALQAARADVAAAQAMVGAMYYDGDGTARDHSTAANWFHHAAGYGHVFSMWRLGWQLRTGDGVPRNEAEAVQ